jgi:hypothetical protein
MTHSGRVSCLRAVAIAVLASGVAAEGGGRQVPAREAAAIPAVRTGTAIVRGRVVDSRDNRPLRRVRLRLTAPDISQQQAISVSTDADGRYEFTGLPARGFTLSAERSGYLTLRFGQRRPREQGKVLDVGDGAVLDNIDFALPRMAVISGRVVDELGDPIAGVWVSALRSMWFQNRRQLGSDEGIETTDEEGEYRLTNLMPGSYVVVARSLEKWTADSGARAETMSYAPSYVPGVADVSEAARVALAIGQEVSNVDLSMVPSRAASVSGRALDSQGRPLRNVMLTHKFPDGPGGGIVGGAGSATVGPGGTFTIANVPPGEYRLQATGLNETAILPLVVNGVDIRDVALTTSAGWTMRGRMTTEAGTPPPLRRTQVTIAAALQVFSPMGMQGGAVSRTSINEDWTFSVTNVAGPAQVRVTPPAGWAVQAILHDRRDLSGETLDLASGETISDVQIILTDRVATVTGQIVAPDDRPAADGTVVIFSSDQAKWLQGSTSVRAARPDQRGRYRIADLLPGDYYAVAVDYVEQGIWNDPDYLRSLVQHARRLALSDAGVHTATLTMVMP